MTSDAAMRQAADRAVLDCVARNGHPPDEMVVGPAMFAALTDAPPYDGTPLHGYIRVRVVRDLGSGMELLP